MLFRSTPGTNRLRDAQAALDFTVRAAYGMKESEDTLAFLLRLNLALADKEAKVGPVTPPGLPASVRSPGDFITPDCIRVPDSAPGGVGRSGEEPEPKSVV